MAVIQSCRHKGKNVYAVIMTCGHAQIIAHVPGRQRPNVGQAWPCPSCPRVAEQPRKMFRETVKRRAKLVPA